MPTSTTSAAGTYTIKSGDSVERIARRHNTTAATLIRLNNIKDPAKIQPGQTLKLPAPAVATTSKPTTPAPTTAAKAPTSGSHLVAQGETFYSIGKKYGISVNQLTAANPGINPAALRPGQRLQLGAATHPAATATPPAPMLASGPPRTVSTAKPPATALPPVPETQKTATQPEVRLVKINSPTTYGEFARTHGNSVGRLNELNNLELGGDTVLAIGSELYVSTQP
jgi:LysM repeat protein